MDVVVALDFRFHTTPDGKVWTSGTFSHAFWTRYLATFDRVRVVARAAAVSRPGAADRRADGEGVEVCPVPFYLGPLEYLAKARAVRRAALGAIGSDDAVILRVGSQLAACIAPSLWRANRPYGLEVIGDPHEAFAPGAVRHPLRPFFRWRNTRLLKQQCAKASGAAYVTESVLQTRYACPGLAIAVSDVELTDEFWVAPPDRQWRAQQRDLIFVGSMEQMYKAPDVLIDALALCLRTDPTFTLTMIGEGRHLPELQLRAAGLGVAGRIRFLGGLPAGGAVREELDRSSLFILPSRTEGLPRAMLEAMARGLPCIGTSVGGIPELLPAEDMVSPGNAEELARKIVDVTRDPERMRRMSTRNLRKASLYREEHLRPRRLTFFRHVADSTARWTANKSSESQR